MNFKELAKQMYNGSWFTVIGCSLDGTSKEQWVDMINALLADEDIVGVSADKWEVFKGKDMNGLFNLEGEYKYDDNLVFLAFPIDSFSSEDIRKLSIFKMKFGARWFDDIVRGNAATLQDAPAAVAHSE